MNNSTAERAKLFSQVIIVIGIIASFYLSYKFGTVTDEWSKDNQLVIDIEKMAFIFFSGLFTTFLLAIPFECLGLIVGKLHNIELTVNSISEDITDFNPTKESTKDESNYELLTNLVSNLSHNEKLELSNQLSKALK